MTELVVVPAERHVERLARDGARGETRPSLRSRLLAELVPDVAFADARQCRLALAMALTDPGAGAARRGAGGSQVQLDLFSAAAAAGAGDDPLLGALRARGGASWVRTVDALDRALGELRARGADAGLLDEVATRSRGVVASRARVLALAMAALDERLARAGACDVRLAPWLLARALASGTARQRPRVVAALVGAERVRSRWLLEWKPADLAWFRALDDVLSQVGGFARVALPVLERPLEGTRERDAFEVLADDVARALDAAPELEPVVAVLGDVTTGIAPPADAGRVRIVGAADAVAQARAVTHVVTEALAAGTPLERIVIALPTTDERTVVPLRRALEEAGVVAHDARGAPPSASPVVATALFALEASSSLDRVAVARVAASGYVDAARLAPEGTEPREATRALARAARELEAAPTAEGADPVTRLARTVGPDGGLEADIITRLGSALANAASARARGERVRAARALWSSLGIGLRAGRGGLATFTRDEAPVGVARAERLAIARDARAWDALSAALDLYETTAQRMGALEQPVDDEVFRLEIADVLDTGSSPPGAGRAGAVRLVRLTDVPGDVLDLLVVSDANEGALPRDAGRDALVSDALADALERVARGAYARVDASVARSLQLAALTSGAAEAERVVLVFTREDASGAPLAASPVVDFLERHGVAIEAVPPAEPRAVDASALLRARRERAREAFFLDPERPRSDVVGALPPLPAIRDALSLETGGGARALAVTGLERFARCAFQGFAHVVLAAREAERREELPDAREEGNLVHDALAAAFTSTAQLWEARPRDEPAIRERALVAAEAVLERSSGHAPLRAVARLRVRDSVRAVVDAALADGTWDFAWAEQSFGGARRRSQPRADDDVGDASPRLAPEAEPWPPLVLDDGDVSVSLRGGIDRIDLTHGKDAARVVDYKRSKSTVQSSTASLGETALQVPLYACVVSRRLGVPTTGAYVATQPRDLADEGGARGGARARASIEQLVSREGPHGLAEIERRALAVVQRVRAGVVVPLPADESECRRCAVSGACRKPRFAMTPEADGEEGA